MEQVQTRYVMFHSDTFDIVGIGNITNPNPDYTLLPVAWELIAPFFTLEKNPVEYYPVVRNNEVVGFRRKLLYEAELVLNTEDNTIKSLRSFENFISSCRIMFECKDDKIVLGYDPNYFDAITNQENLEKLTNAGDTVYNLYITRKGDPFTIYEQYDITLAPFLENSIIELPYTGIKDISLYAIVKN